MAAPRFELDPRVVTQGGQAGRGARDARGDMYAWFTEGFDTGDLKDAMALLADLASPA